MNGSCPQGARLNCRSSIPQNYPSQFRPDTQTRFHLPQVLNSMKMRNPYQVGHSPTISYAPRPPAPQAEIPLQALSQNRVNAAEYSNKKTSAPFDYYGYSPNSVLPRNKKHHISYSQEHPPNTHNRSPYEYSRQPYYYDENKAQQWQLPEEDNLIPPPPPIYRYCHPNGVARPPPTFSFAASSPSSTPRRQGAYRRDVEGHTAKPPSPVLLQKNYEMYHSPYQARMNPPRSRGTPGELHPLDIVCGRGAPTNYHYGNQVFKDIVQEYQTAYLCAKRSDKPQIAMKLLDIVKTSGARFVRREKAAGQFCWVEIEGKGAYEKVCQALRDGAPDLRRQVLSSTKKKVPFQKTEVDPKRKDEENGAKLE